MIRFNMFFATEARIRFFQLLRMAAHGEDVIVINKDSGQKFKISMLAEEVKPGKQTILKQLSDANLKSKSPEEIKKIIENKLAE